MKILDKITSPKKLKKLGLNQLKELSSEIREFLIDSVSVTGGHLASNLGVVELTIALHYCFNSPDDKIIWDVGHQAYIHKILTGRKDMFHTLRKFNGLSGFPKSGESKHDAFGAGHSSTSISAALGFAISRDLSGGKNNVVSVIGDGSMTGGLAFEALNNAGRTNTKIIVVLNDNQMSISENVGALSRYLNKIRSAPSYISAKDDVHKFLQRVPVVGGRVDKFIGDTKEVIKNFLIPGDFFEELGFDYIGPVDGHDLNELIKVFNKAKKIDKPTLLHVITKKGKGYCNAEEQPAKFHGVDSFNKHTGLPTNGKSGLSYSEIAGNTLIEMAEQNEKLVAITAAMASGTGLSPFEQKFPKRLFDVGIAEAHAVTFAAGLAKSGHLPVFVVYSTFLQRAYDQIIHDVCIQNLHVVFAIDRAGIVGADGETHQGVFDLSYLTHIPNMTVMAPKNGRELALMLKFAAEMNSPVAVRYPRGTASTLFEGESENEDIVFGKCEIIKKGRDIIIISGGNMFDTAYAVYEKLLIDGLTPALVNARFIKPIDLELVKRLKDYRHVVVLEDNVKTGGLGSAILQNAAELGILINTFTHVAFPDNFIEHGSVQELYQKYKMDLESVYIQIKEAFNEQ